MKYIITYFLLHLIPLISFALPTTDSLIYELNNSIKYAKFYDSQKLKTISGLHELMSKSSNNDLQSHYRGHLALYEEYKNYNYDSAFYYSKKLQNFAEYTNDLSLLADAKIKLAFVLLSGGMFKETFDSLNTVSIAGAADSLKGEYYTLMGIAYYSLADFNGDSHSIPLYNNKANQYLDSAISFYPPASFEYIYYSSLIFLKKGKTDSAISYLEKLIQRKELTWHQIALTTSTIGGIFISPGHEDEAKPYLIRASIADIKSSTKETLALFTLAGIIYKEGKIETR